jgi:hypothetical protein
MPLFNQRQRKDISAARKFRRKLTSSARGANDESLPILVRAKRSQPGLKTKDGEIPLLNRR